MKQLIFIRGGEAFDSMEQYYKFLEDYEYSPFEQHESRRSWLEKELAGEYQYICPNMPCKQNATYKARKIWFEKLFPYLGDELVVVGHSLGAWFLMKYLVEEKFPKPIAQLHLVAAPLAPSEGEGGADFAYDHDLLPRIAEQVNDIFLYHSKDDDIVPFETVEKIAAYLPQAKVMTFTDRGHFFTLTFPEILENIVH